MIKNQSPLKKQSVSSGARLQIKKPNKEKDAKSLQKQTIPIPQEVQSKQKGKKQSKIKDQKKDKKDKGKQAKGKGKDKQQQQLNKQSKENKDKTKKDKKKDKKDKKGKQKQEKDNQKDKKKDKKSLKKSRQSDKQLDTIKSIHKSQDRAKMTIEQLIANYKDAAQKLLFNNHGTDPEKQKQIQAQLSRLKKQKQRRHEKLQELQKHKQQILQSRMKQKQIKEQLKKERLKEKKIERINHKLQNIQQQSNKRKIQYENFLEYVKERRKFLPRFKRYEKEYQQKIQGEAENQKEVFQELQKLYHPMNLQQIKKFQDDYKTQRLQSESYRLNKIRLESDLLNQQNKKLQQSLWRGKCHQIVKGQLQIKQIKKMADKVKQENRKQFGKYLNQNLHRQIQGGGGGNDNQNEKNVQQQQILPKQNIHVRQKYIQGINYGLITQDKTVPLTIQQTQQLGYRYLAHIRQLNSHRKNKTVDYAQGSNYKASVSQDLKGKSHTFKIKRKSNPYYPSDMNKKSLDFNNYEAIQFTLQKIEANNMEKQLQDKILKHGQYEGILQIQQRKRQVGSLMVKQINQKLDLLNKL